MFRSILIAGSIVLASALATQVRAESISRNPGFSAAGQWAVVQAGGQRVSHCMLGIRSDAPAPKAGQPQFMITADDQFAILRVRAAEWSFAGARDIAVTLAANGSERQPAAAVRGTDLIDVAFGVDPARIDELAASSHLEIRAEGTTVRLPLKGLAEVLPVYRDCLANLGQPLRPQVHAAVQ